ncbi:unnamed protein product [Rotaria socialis]|uniref:AIG1-type G domain-containing protein n=1 Tax=Rotaria socialis TaxID=392032 RepID=A0A821SA75_9BILA|nr:unnamed protein product [Rotaria socialis]
MNEIKADYTTDGKFHVTRAEPRNIMLIGRTRTGKSTIKSLLVDPTVVPTDLTLKSDSRDPLFETFHVSDNRIVLNIIDTPGLFEHGDDEMSIRDNDAILNTIEVCVNREITKFHVVCFCAAVTAGLNREDIDSLKLLVKFLGDEISKNSCLIITRCESKDDQQREKMRKELSEDTYFKEIAPFFNSIEPFPLSELLISEVRRAHEKVKSIKDDEIQKMRSRTKKQAEIIEELRVARLNKKGDIAEIIDRLTAISLPSHEQHNCFQERHRELEKCLIS